MSRLLPNDKPIYKIGELAHSLGISNNKELKELCEEAVGLYSPFKQEKKNGGFRHIDNPHEKLKRKQKLIKEKFLDQVELPQQIMGGVTGFGIKDYTLRHVSQAEIVCIDIKNWVIAKQLPLQLIDSSGL